MTNRTTKQIQIHNTDTEQKDKEAENQNKKLERWEIIS